MIRFISSVRKTAMLAAFAISFSVLLSSCIKNHSYDGVNIPVASLMAFNLSPDKSNIGFSLSGNSLTTSGLAYGNYTGNYLNIYPGERPVNAFDYSSSAVYATSQGSFMAGKYYSLFFIGVNNKYRNILTEDSYDSLSNLTGKAYVRYINAIPDSVNSLSVTLGSSSTNIQNTVSYGTVSPFTLVDSGNLSIAIKNSDGIDTSRTIAIDQKKVYTILLSGMKNSTTTPVSIKYILNGSLSEGVTNNAGVVRVRGSVN